MSTYVYDANQVAVSFFGIPIDSGYADGEFLTIIQNENDWVEVVGTDGTVAVCATNNRTAKIQLKLLQVSPGNDALSAIRTLQVSTQNGTGFGPFLVKDLLGTSMYSALHCWVAKPPDVGFDRAAKDRVWTIGVSDLVRIDGGNTPV
jgi:hypothetical protein